MGAVVSYPIRYKARFQISSAFGKRCGKVTWTKQRNLRNVVSEARQERKADVAKLVDARDLKSLDFGHTGSSPVVRTIYYI